MKYLILVTWRTTGAEFESLDLAVEKRFETGTYVGLSGEILRSKVLRVVGAFDVLPDVYDFAIPSPTGLRNHLAYEEESIGLDVSQLLGETLSLGARYRFSKAVLNESFPDIPEGLLFIDFQPSQHFQASLHRLELFAIFNHHSGLHAQATGRYFNQSDESGLAEDPPMTFWQLDAMVGYRFLHRRADIEIGLLNILNQDYHLNPLNLHPELPRRRTFSVQCRLSF